MIWLAGQIAVCLVLAAGLGLAVGWALRGRRAAPPAESRPQPRPSSRGAVGRPAPPRSSRPSIPPPRAEAPAVYGLFGPAAEAPVDDLQAILGIGPVMARQLAGIGLVTYRQLVRLDASDAARVREAIGFFPGDAACEAWKAQAARLHRETYGTAP